MNSFTVNTEKMTAALSPALLLGEKSLCPVYAAIRRDGFHIRYNYTDFTYATITDMNRLIIYRFRFFYKDLKAYDLKDVHVSRHGKGMLGQYYIDLNTSGSSGYEHILMYLNPKDVGSALPDQGINAETFYMLLTDH